MTDAEHIELVRQLAATTSGAQITCSSSSMEPAIVVGDVVSVFSTAQLRIGDVILFETSANNALVLHRIVLAIPGLPWVAQVGDAAAARATALIPRSRVIGVAPSIPSFNPRPAALCVAIYRYSRRGIRLTLNKLGLPGLAAK